MDAARKAAGRSMVLLKNEGGTLPLSKGKKVAVIGPLGDDPHAMLGPWWGRGDQEDAVSVFEGIRAQNPQTTFTEGCKMEHLEPPNVTPAGECGSEAGFPAAVAAATAADQIVLALGESREQSGEAASRSEIDLPGKQEELLRQVKAAAGTKPVAVVLFNGRPLALENMVGDAPAILEAWFPGVQAGNAVADVVFGEVNPGGKLPVSFPRRVGQVPIYYNHEPTGRPCDATQKYNSRYRDIDSCEPQYPFGFGLSYSKFEVSNLRLSSSRMSRERERPRVGRRAPRVRARGRRGRAALHPRPRGEPLAAGAATARLRARDALAGPEADGDVHARQERRRLPRQQRALHRRAGRDPGLRRQQLEGGAHAEVHGDGLAATATRRVSGPNGVPSRSP